MPQLDISTFLPQLFWLVVSFTLLYFILNRFCLPKMVEIFRERDSKISHALSKAEKNRKEASRLKDDYEKIINQAMKTKSNMISESVKEISTIMDHKLTEHELGMKVIISESEQKLKEYKKEARDDVNQIAAEAAEEVLSSLLDIKVTKEAILKQIESKGGHGV
ncbi:MAG: hypothetical protein N4A31_05015 [Rickettsiales bacterium]|jgi:F-type H+-transporting ATPase subunit b|nr:hypothetical protein [Rickettsiales bacterium]